MNESRAPEQGLTAEDPEVAEKARATALCLWCGTPRPVDVDICPTCANPWIDATIDEARAGRLDQVEIRRLPMGASRPWWRQRWMPVALAVTAVAIYAATFWILWEGTGTGNADTLGDGIVTATVPITATTPPTSAATTAPTTTPSTTTSTTTTTTTSTTTTLPPLPVVEPPYETSELTLGAFALGPIRFGSVDDGALGRLVATFGQPDSRFPVGENWGLCPNDVGRGFEFGLLSIILREDPDGEAIVGYRLRWRDDGAGTEDATQTLQSISGLRLGDPLSRAQALYSRVATTPSDDGTQLYVVQRSSDLRTLLWGELSSDADPVILSINSPRPCDGGPFG